MIRKLSFAISDVAPYINWPYFDYAWGVGGKGHEEREQLHRDAELRMQKLEGRYTTTALFGLFRANSDGDDILVNYNGLSTRLPMLRQQSPDNDGLCYCLSDFIRPSEAGDDCIGLCLIEDAYIIRWRQLSGVVLVFEKKKVTGLNMLLDFGMNAVEINGSV